MSQFRVVLDACVLYPQGLRDLLMSWRLNVFSRHIGVSRFRMDS